MKYSEKYGAKELRGNTTSAIIISTSRKHADDHSFVIGNNVQTDHLDIKK